MLACGAEPKSTFCVVEVDRAWIGHHIGDLGDVETTQSFREGIEHFERLFARASTWSASSIIMRTWRRLGRTR